MSSFGWILVLFGGGSIIGSLLLALIEDHLHGEPPSRRGGPRV